MSTDKLVSALKQEAEVKIAKTTAETDELVKRLLDTAREQAGAIEAEIERVRDSIREKNANLERSRLAILERRRLAHRENAYVAATLAAAEEMYRRFAADDLGYADFIAAEFDAARQELGAIGEIRADTVTASAIRGKEWPETKIVIDDSAGLGFKVFDTTGRTSITSTLKSRLEKAWAMHAPEFVRTIAGYVKE